MKENYKGKGIMHPVAFNKIMKMLKDYQNHEITNLEFYFKLEEHLK